jgi:hypothetical protein
MFKPNPDYESDKEFDESQTWQESINDAIEQANAWFTAHGLVNANTIHGVNEVYEVVSNYFDTALAMELSQLFDDLEWDELTAGC